MIADESSDRAARDEGDHIRAMTSRVAAVSGQISSAIAAPADQTARRGGKDNYLGRTRVLIDLDGFSHRWPRWMKFFPLTCSPVSRSMI